MPLVAATVTLGLAGLPASPIALTCVLIRETALRVHACVLQASWALTVQWWGVAMDTARVMCPGSASVNLGGQVTIAL